jgi:hypothetical protein
MSFSAFSSFLHKLAFQRSKSQLKNLLFVPDFDFSAFQLKKTAEKQEQTGPKRTEGWDSRRHEGGGGCISVPLAVLSPHKVCCHTWLCHCGKKNLCAAMVLDLF